MNKLFSWYFYYLLMDVGIVIAFQNLGKIKILCLWFCNWFRNCFSYINLLFNHKFFSFTTHIFMKVYFSYFKLLLVYILVFFPGRCLGSVIINKYVIVLKFHNLFCYFSYFLSIKKLKNSHYDVISKKKTERFEFENNILKGIVLREYDINIFL